jgi:hypothetical protein
MKTFAINLISVQLCGRGVLAALVVVFSSGIANTQPTEIPLSRSTETRLTSVNVPENSRPTIVLISDISFSIKKSIGKMRNMLRQIVIAVPESATVAVVTVGARSEKRIFTDRAEALSYIEKIDANSKFTDLERGTDTALALLQEIRATKPTLVVYLTDGQISLPKEIADKTDFKTILIREFSSRPDVTALILSVSSRPMDITGLPPNVEVIPLSNWEESEQHVNQTLVKQIPGELAENSVSEVPAGNEGSLPEKKYIPLPFSLKLGLPVVMIVVLAAFWLWFRRRKRDRKMSEEGIAEVGEIEPLDVLRPEDLLRQNSERSPGLVSLIEFYDGKNTELVHLLTGERLSIGSSARADIRFPALKQEKGLEINFDGKCVLAFRLHPKNYYEVDEVCFSGVKALPNQTKFYLNNGDTLKIGKVQIAVKIVEAAVGQILREKGNRLAEQGFRAGFRGVPTSRLSPMPNENSSRWD